MLFCFFPGGGGSGQGTAASVGSKDDVMVKTYIPMFQALLATKCPKAHPATETDQDKVNKRLRTIRNRTVKQRAGMLGLSAVVNAYPYRVPCFVPEILVDVVRAVEVFDGGTVGACSSV